MTSSTEGATTVPGQGGWNSFACYCYSPNGISMGQYGNPGQAIITYD
jgi:hypothetical protein